MYELIQASEHCFYIQSPAKIGLVRTEGDGVYLIDSGNDKDAGKKVRRILEEKGWTLKAILNTHSHADHIGGNRYLQNQTGCRVFAPGMERDFTVHPVLEPSYLYGGNPPKSLRHKFMMAQASDAEPLTAEVLPEGMEIVPLPGHSFDMVGFRTAEDVVYLADCLSGEETLAKYQVGFLVDVAAYLDTLQKVKEMEAKLFVPAHAKATENIAPLAQVNMDKVHEIGERILEICREPAGFDRILQRIFEAYDLEMTAEQHALVGSTIRSYLTWLTDGGEIAAEFQDNVLLWRARQ